MTKDEKNERIRKVKNAIRSQILSEQAVSDLTDAVFDALEEPPKFWQTFRQNEIVCLSTVSDVGPIITYHRYGDLDDADRVYAEKLSPDILAATVAFEDEKYYKCYKLLDTTELFLYKTNGDWRQSLHGRYVASCPDWDPEEGEI